MSILNFLGFEEVELIHEASLRILNETGVILTHPPAVDLLVDSGARINNNKVLIPPSLVESCLEKCPQKVSIKGRGGAIKILGEGALSFHNLGGARDIFDQATMTHRYATIQDIRDSTRLLDALPNCNTITPFFTPQDAEARYAVRMAEVLGNPKEILSLSVSPVSPLMIPDHEAEAIMEIARLGITFGSLPCPTMGTTAPFSIAGAIAQQNAEVLASIVLVQLVHPGLPVIYCGRLAMMEPRTGISVWGGLEMGLASAGTVYIGHRYGLPVNVYGFSTNAHSLDIQNGFERSLNAILPCLAGADELSGIGEMEAGVSGSYAQMVIDNEFAANILRARNGFNVNEDSLGVDVISSVMNGSRNFLGNRHTVKYLKGGEILLTRLAERGTWESWNDNEQKGMAENAQSEAERILREHLVPGLDPIQENELDLLMDAALKEMKKD